MRRLLTSLLLTVLLTTGAWAQESTEVVTETNNSVLNRFSFTFKGGTPSFALSSLGDAGSSIGNIGIAEIGTSFKANSRLSFGISMMGGLGNCSEGYFNDEGQFIEVDDDDDDDDDMDFEGDDEDEDGDDDEDECESDEMEAVMGTVTYVLSDDVPVFVQAAVGYSLDAQAPAYSVLVGYHHNIFSQLGISGGLRYSEVLSQLNGEGQNFSRSGLKAEIGLHWNF